MPSVLAGWAHDHGTVPLSLPPTDAFFNVSVLPMSFFLFLSLLGSVLLPVLP